MYSTALQLHSVLRWLVFLSLAYSIYISASGYFGNKPFLRFQNAVRHWTATIAHIQMMAGILVYTQSPLIKTFSFSQSPFGISFYAIWHPVVMLAGIITLTIGSAKAKRAGTDHAKYKTMLVYFSIALLLIIVSIPWPFSPLSQRPYIR